MGGRVLIIDEETTTREELEQALRQHGFEVTVPSDAASGLTLSDKGLFDVLICNVNLSPIDGLEVLKRCRAACPEMMVIMMAAEGTIESAVQAIKAGAYDFLTRPLSSDRVALVVERAYERKNLIEENVRFQQELGSKSSSKSKVTASSGPICLDRTRKKSSTSSPWRYG